MKWLMRGKTLRVTMARGSDTVSYTHLDVYKRQALALSLLAALLVFLFEICAVLLTIASVILAVLGLSLIHI